MKVRCEKCQHHFGVPLSAPGSIAYTQCKSIFRVTYRFRTPCPSCHTVLQLVPQGREAVGVPYENWDADEVTEALHSVPVPMDDRTLPKTMEPVAQSEPPPTVRVKAPTVRSQKFQYIERPVERAKPVHVAIRASSRRFSLPIAKIVLGAVALVGVILTVTLTTLALRTETPSGAAVEKPETPSAASATVAKETGPRGGPEFQAERIQDDPPEIQPTPRTLITPTPKPKRISRLELPKGEKLTSKFGVREDPFTGQHRFHGGIDLAASKRSEVKVALDGKVRFVGTKGGYGKVVIVDHADGYQTLYGHLEKPLVREGMKVKQGDLIGLVGESGRATGPHLHFEVLKDGKRVDPLRVKLITKTS